MRIPVLRGVIDRRILVNYRADPDVLSKLLPSPFRPKLVEGRMTERLRAGSIFGSLQEASEFFRRGSLGYSATRTAGEFDGLELKCLDAWSVRPLAVEKVESSFFGDDALFPPGSVEF